MGIRLLYVTPITDYSKNPGFFWRHQTSLPRGTLSTEQLQQNDTKTLIFLSFLVVHHCDPSEERDSATRSLSIEKQRRSYKPLRSYRRRRPKINKMTAAIRNKLALVALVSATCLVDHGHSFAPNHNHNKATFAPPRSSPLVKKTKTPTTTAHRALPVDAAADMAHHAAAASGVGWDQIVQSASHFLSQDEAAAAAAAAPAVAGEATGWWGAYVNFFKTTLLAVHGAVDGPLKSMGIEQSWGVSIGLFTLCT